MLMPQCMPYSGSRDQFERDQAQLLITELGWALTLLKGAAASGDPALQQRNYSAAKLAYETVVRSLPYTSPTEKERQIIDRDLAVVQAMLQSDGSGNGLNLVGGS